MELNNDKMIGNLSENINKDVAVPNDNAKEIIAVVK